MASTVGQMNVVANTPAPVVSAPLSISGRAVATGSLVPTLLLVLYKYVLVGIYRWPQMDELEAALPSLSVAILAWMHHRAQRVREVRDRRFLLSLVKAGVVIPLPPSSPVRDVPVPQPPPPPAPVPAAPDGSFTPSGG